MSDKTPALPSQTETPTEVPNEPPSEPPNEPPSEQPDGPIRDEVSTDEIMDEDGDELVFNATGKHLD